ncbi:hypothetical protein CCS38_24095 [Streptomyces purpurogeneiscleroticus]|nr:hypothetical protein [Streptomyces purpurogeneiscleroticus]
MATPVCRFDDFLGSAAADSLFNHVCVARANRLAMEISSSGAGAKLAPMWQVPGDEVPVPEFIEAVTGMAPVVREMIGIEPSDGEPTVSYELCMHNHGDHHGDRFGPRTAEAGSLHFVYYLHRRPRAFTGGQLRIFDTTLWDGEPACAPSFRDIAADHDSIVFFPAGSWYEDRPIDCPSRRLLDGRFALRGHLT